MKQSQIPVIMDSKSTLEFDTRTPKKNFYVYACAFLAGMTSILLGYDIGVMSGAIIFIQEDLKVNDEQIEILVGILNIYALIGSNIAGRTSDFMGRRYTFAVAGVIFFVGAILMGFATNYAFLMVGRFVAGIGVGYGMMVAPVYTAEVAPASSRGVLTSFSEIFINVGVLLGYISNFAFSKLPTHLGWRFMLGIGAIPSVLLALGVLVMPESPRWLVMKGRLGEARKVLEKTSYSPEEAELRMDDIKEVAGIPKDCNDDVVEVKRQAKTLALWKELLFHPTPAVRHILVASTLLYFFQQASGTDAVVLYSSRIFEKAGIKSKDGLLLCSIAVGAVKTIFILIGAYLIDRAGRRPVLLTSGGGMVVSLVLLGAGLLVIENSAEKVTWAIRLSIFTVLSFMAFFSVGFGPMIWVYSSEIFPLRFRALGVGLGVAVNRAISGIIGMTFISLYKAITIGGAFLLFAGVAAISWIFCFTCLPETRGKTLEETEALFGYWYSWRSVAKTDRKDQDTVNGPEL